MSLLNDMLRDLTHHQRKTDEQGPIQSVNQLDEEHRYLLNDTRVTKPVRNAFLPSAIIFIVVLLGFFFAKSNFLPANNNAIGTQEDELSVGASPVSPKSASGDTPPSLEEAESNRLSANAESHPEPELTERLVALEVAINQLSSALAQASTQRTSQEGQQVPYEGETIAEYASLPESEVVDEQSVRESESISIQDPFVEPVRASQVKEFAPQEELEPQLSIAPNTVWQDKQSAISAEQLVAQGQQALAVAQLQQFIAHSHQPRESTKTLLNIFVSTNDATGIERLLLRANYLDRHERAFYSAKAALIEQQPLQAIELLEEHLNAADDDENYRSFLAGLYQQSGRHLEAANHYRRLLSVFGDKSTYWLGLALSQDALNQFQTAQQAYQRVAQYELQPEVRSYIEQRLTALQTVALQQ